MVNYEQLKNDSGEKHLVLFTNRKILVITLEKKKQAVKSSNYKHNMEFSNDLANFSKELRCKKIKFFSKGQKLVQFIFLFITNLKHHDIWILLV